MFSKSVQPSDSRILEHANQSIFQRDESILLLSSQKIYDRSVSQKQSIKQDDGTAPVENFNRSGDFFEKNIVNNR